MERYAALAERRVQIARNMANLCEETKTRKTRSDKGKKRKDKSLDIPSEDGQNQVG